MAISLINEVIKQLKNSDNENYRVVAEHLKKTVKFKLPPNGEILAPNQGLAFETIYRDILPIIKLPYEHLAIEYEITHKNAEAENKVVARIVALVRERENDIVFQPYVKLAASDRWDALDIMGVVTTSWTNFTFSNISLDQHRPSKYEETTLRSIATSLFNLMAALNCENVEVTNELVTLKKRMGGKKSKPQRVGEIVYKTLIIDTQQASEQQQTAQGNGTSKKQHLRRGHIRHLKNKTIWVNACVVGDKGKGQVEKDYQVV